MTTILGSADDARVRGATRPQVDLVRERLGFRGSALAALGVLAGSSHPFALTGRWAGGGALVGCDPRRLLEASADPFAALDDLPSLTAAAPDGAVGGGWFGFLGYRLAGRLERLPPSPPRPDAIPAFHLAYYDLVLRQDASGAWWLEGLRDAGGDPDFDARRQALSERLQVAEGRVAPAEGSRPGAFRVAAPGHAGHRWAVAEAVERIAAGDLFQVNLGLRLEAKGRFDPVALYTRAAAALEPAYGAVFATEWGGVVSLSPELFLRRAGSEVVTGPIKGTVARSDGAGAERDVLLASGKDAAEHVMIVDLMRNDLGRVCEYGSVTRTENRRIEPHPGVWHLVSDVEGELRDGVGDGELLRATFPPGSVTGAPKVQSMRLISELEGSGRELYTGALGFASPAAGLELSVAIRSFELTHDRVWIGAGGGIVADSRPAAELAEALAKAAPLIAAIGGRLAGEGAASVEPVSTHVPRATALVTAERPDPALGLLETVLVSDGRPLDLDAHLERLEGSAKALYGEALPPDAAAIAGREAAGAGDCRLRLHLRPRMSGARLEVETAALPSAGSDPVTLIPVLLPGGLGAHKWRDRRLLDALAERLGDRLALLVDSDGSVLEAAWGNVWVVVAGEHRTPALDGRLLPGIARARQLDRLRSDGIVVREQRLTLDDLAAGEVYLTSSLRAPTPVLVHFDTWEPDSG